MKSVGHCSFALLTALLLAGCQSKSASSSGVEEMVPLGPQYSAKRGLLVPEETQRSLGVKLVEVTEQKLVTSVDMQLRVYQITRGAVLASGSVTPEQAKLLSVGTSVAVRIGDGESVTAKITRLDDQLRKSTGAVEVLVQIPNGAEGLAAGMFVQASASIESASSVVTIPRAALIQCSDGYSVYTVNGEHFVRTPVKVGAISQDLVEIKDGLYANDQVVLQPVMSLWLTELAAVKGGQACCVAPPKGK